MKKAHVLYSFTFCILALTGCQKQMFGVDETMWGTLNEQERVKVIEDYNKKEEQRIANEQATREKKLENERAAKELEAKTAPYYAAADVVSSLCGNSKCKSRKISKKGFRSANVIQSVSSTYRGQVVNIEGTAFEISPFSRMSDAWVSGQEVKLSSSDEEAFYSVKIKNLDNGEKVFARKKK